MASRVTSGTSSSSVRCSVAGGPLGQDEPANLARGVPHADLDVVAEVEAHLGEDGAGFLDHACTVGGVLVPARRKAEHGPGVAGAQGADDDVVGRGSVLDDDDVLALGAAEAEFLDGGGAVRQEPSAVLGVGPGLGDHLGAVERTHVGLVVGDERIDHLGVDQTAFGEQLFECLGAQGRGRGLAGFAGGRHEVVSR